MDGTDAVLYQEIPNNKLQGKSLENWSSLDMKVVAVYLLTLVAIWIWTHPLVLMFALIVLTPFLIRLPKSYGRVYYEILRGIRGSIRQAILKGLRWTGDPNVSSRTRALLKLLGQGIPLSLSEVSATISGEDYRCGLLESTDRNKPFVYLPILADGASFNNRDVNGMHRAVQELTRITNQALMQTHLRAGISYVRITGPLDDSNFMAYLRLNSDPVPARLEMFDLTEDDQARVEWLRDIRDNLVPNARLHGASTPFYLIMITIKRGREWSQARKGKLSDTELFDIPIIELGRSLVNDLENSPILEMKGVRLLDLPELALLVRSSWDVDGIEQYHRERLTGKIPTTSQQVDQIRSQPGGEQLLDKLLRPWPTQEIRTTSGTNCVKFDGNFLSVVRVVQMPKQLRADQALELHTIMRTGQWTRQAMVGESVSGTAETRNLVIRRSALINFDQTFFAGRVVAPPNRARRNKELANETDIVSAETIAQHFNGLWTSVGTSLEEAIKTRKVLITALSAKGFVVEPVENPDFIVDGVISGILGINRL